MSNEDIPAVARLEEELREVIDRFRHANLLTLAELVGVLHVMAYAVTAEAFDDDD